MVTESCLSALSPCNRREPVIVISVDVSKQEISSTSKFVSVAIDESPSSVIGESSMKRHFSCFALAKCLGPTPENEQERI